MFDSVRPHGLPPTRLLCPWDFPGNRPMTRWSASLIIREMQIKTTMSYHLTPARMVIIKNTINYKCWWGCGNRKPLCPVGRNVNWYSHLWKIAWRFLKTLKIELPCNTAILLLDIFPKNKNKQNTNLNRHTHSNAHCSLIHNS